MEIAAHMTKIHAVTRGELTHLIQKDIDDIGRLRFDELDTMDWRIPLEGLADSTRAVPQRCVGCRRRRCCGRGAAVLAAFPVLVPLRGLRRVRAEVSFPAAPPAVPDCAHGGCENRSMSVRSRSLPKDLEMPLPGATVEPG